MPQFSTTYEPGATRGAPPQRIVTTTSAPSAAGAAGGGVDPALLDMMRELFRLRLDRAKAATITPNAGSSLSSLGMKAGFGAPSQRRAPASSGSMSSPDSMTPERAIALEKQRLALRGLTLQQQADEQGPPRRWTFPMGSGGFLTTDPESMNAYQRNAYTPDSSALVPSPDDQARASARTSGEFAREVARALQSGTFGQPRPSTS